MLGVTVTVRFAPDPPNTIAESGTTLALPVVAVTTSDPAGVCASPTVNASAPVLWPTVTVWFAISVIVGAVFGTPPIPSRI